MFEGRRKELVSDLIEQFHAIAYSAGVCAADLAEEKDDFRLRSCAYLGATEVTRQADLIKQNLARISELNRLEGEKDERNRQIER